MKNNYAIVTWAGGDKFCKKREFWTFIGSLNNVRADVYIFTDSMPIDVKEELQKRNIRIIEINPDSVKCIIRDRHLAFYSWLCEMEMNYDAFFFCDSKDVIFQFDPFILYKNQGVILFSEGMKHEQSLWNLNDQSMFQVDLKFFKTMIQDQRVFNGGTIMGRGHKLKNHFLLIWATTLKSIAPCTDQATLNYLYQYLIKSKDYTYSDPGKDCLCLTGEAVKEGWMKVRYDAGVYKNSSGETYAIVHQWDRLKEKEMTIERYLDEKSYISLCKG